MAETAYIINPKRMVLLPDRESRLPDGGYDYAEALIAAKKDLPGATVVCYVNFQRRRQGGV